MTRGKTAETDGGIWGYSPPSRGSGIAKHQASELDIEVTLGEGGKRADENRPAI